ncbi:glycosyltransferase [Roseomonas sp. OT10]|uniref:glycosyltransferase n=1 Tax=Roseomonas cutis TaxID=2897332 RepID=UPI001E39828B|nr:glycosyltransferase [Roseomonas sp. OT10]UFN48734.1 glycosyltransferase [Roseomonas sp. OT10]
MPGTSLPGEGRRRVCLATDSAEPSGVGTHLLLLAEGLALHDEVVVVARHGSPLLRRAASLGLRVKSCGPGEEGGLAHWLRDLAPEVVHVHAGIGWEGHGLAAAAREAGVPAILRTEHLPYLLTDPAQRAEHAAATDGLAALVCVSESAARSHAEAGIDPARLVAIANGVPVPRPARDPAALRAELGLDGPVLLMVGRFTPQKNHALLLDALPGLLERHPRATALLVGEGPLGCDVARAVAARGLAARVRLLGGRGDVPDLMAAADLLVLPSAFEGLPLVLLEAMALGLPAVATRVGGATDAVEDGVTGWLVPPGDAPALAGALARALDDPGARAAAGEAARRRHAEHFGAARMLRDTRALYAAHAPAVHRSRTRLDRLRIGFVGAGGIAHRHFGVLERFDDVAIAAVADPDMGRATEAAARFGARAFADHEAMLAAEELDALYICVPPFAHGAPERAAIARNLPFFVEKPVAIDLATAEAVAAAVARAGLVTSVGYHLRSLDTVEEARALLRGNPARLLSGYWLDATPPPPWWWRMDRSGGQMVEQMTHIIDLARHLAGEVEEVFGMATHTPRPDFPGLDVPTVSTASLRFASGAVGNFAATCLLRWNHRVGLHVFADGLAMEMTDRDIMVDVGRGRPVRGAGDDPVRVEDRAFLDAVRGGPRAAIRCDYAEALATHRVVLAIVESARTGRPVRPGAVAARQAEHV